MVTGSTSFPKDCNNSQFIEENTIILYCNISIIGIREIIYKRDLESQNVLETRKQPQRETHYFYPTQYKVGFLLPH